MPIDIYQPYVNPITGETYQGISHTEEAFFLRWSLRPAGHVPLQHAWLNQDMIYHVDRGRLCVRMGKQEHTAGPGESIHVPRRQPVVAYNTGREVCEVRVEYRPGLDHDVFWQCYFGLMQDGYLTRNGSIDVPKMGYFLKRMNAKCIARPAYLPEALYGAALSAFHLQGKLAGWEKLFAKYTGRN